jgi:hypothetical protein
MRGMCRDVPMRELRSNGQSPGRSGLAGGGVGGGGGYVVDELADLAECVHCFGQERPEDVEGMRWYGVNTDPGVDAAFFAVLGEQLVFLQDRVAGACVDEDGRQPA